MSAFYGENSPVSTENYTTFAIDHIKRLTLPTLNPWVCRDFASNLHVSNTCHKLDDQPSSEDSYQFIKDWQETNEVRLVVGVDGKPSFILVSAPPSHEIAFVDWISFTFKRYTFADLYIDVRDSDIEDVCVFETSKKIESIFGFIVGKKKNSGKFYENAYELITKSGQYVGLVHIGGQHNSIHVEITGEGCKLGDYGWQESLFKFLKYANGSKITRLDLAHDDIEGSYLDIDDLNELETEGGFYRFGKPAKVSWFGDWKYLDRDKLGRTLAIGSRESDKYLRAYEKGRQLGDKASSWLRLEVELKAKHTIIPFEAVINPSGFFINLYPCFRDIFQYEDQSQSVIKYVKKTAELTIEKAKDSFKRQYGKYLHFFGSLLGRDDCFDQLSVSETPKRLSHLMHDWASVHPDFALL